MVSVVTIKQNGVLLYTSIISFPPGSLAFTNMSADDMTLEIDEGVYTIPAFNSCEINHYGVTIKAPLPAPGKLNVPKHLFNKNQTRTFDL